MFYSLCYVFMIFFLSSIIGYVIEITFCSINQKRIVLNRGFLLGPYIPIYGVGTIFIIAFLFKYINDPIAFFWLTVMLCTFIEYITSYIMEGIFKVRWWDYSDEPFNYNGRVCLKNSMFFGLGGLAILYFIFPFINNLLNMMSPIVLIIISIICFIIFMTDLGFTTSTLIGVRSNLLKFEGKDVTKKAHMEVMNAIKKHDFSFNRIVNAFPSIDNVNIKEYSVFKDYVLKYDKKKKCAKGKMKVE